MASLEERMKNESKFDPSKIKNTNTEKIWNHSKEIRSKIKKGNSLKQIQEEYCWLYETYPKIFSLACNEKMDLNKLQYMLNKLADMKNGNISEYQASGQVGSVLAKEFVYSKLDMSKEPEIDY